RRKGQGTGVFASIGRPTPRFGGRPPITLKPTTGAAPLTAAREPRFMEPQSARLRPDSAAILDTSRPIATEPDAKAKILLARVHRHRPAGGAGGCDRAFGRDRRPGIGAILQFRRALPARPAQRRQLVRRRFLCAIPAAGPTTSPAPGFLPCARACQA